LGWVRGTLTFCGADDGWCSFVPVVDCCTRELLGWELDHTGRAKTAQRALEGVAPDKSKLIRFPHNSPLFNAAAPR